jgi:hypothetical protein
LAQSHQSGVAAPVIVVRTNARDNDSELLLIPIRVQVSESVLPRWQSLANHSLFFSFNIAMSKSTWPYSTREAVRSSAGIVAKVFPSGVRNHCSPQSPWQDSLGSPSTSGFKLQNDCAASTSTISPLCWLTNPVRASARPRRVLSLSAPNFSSVEIGRCDDSFL